MSGFHQPWTKLEEMFQSTRILKLARKHGRISRVSVGVDKLKCHEISLFFLDTQFLISKAIFEKTEKLSDFVMSEESLSKSVPLSKRKQKTCSPQCSRCFGKS